MMSQPLRRGRPKPIVELSGTLIDTEQEARQARLSGLKRQPPIPTSMPAAPQHSAPTTTPAAASQPGATGSASVYRPPIPMLIVFDDDRMEGEVIGIREPRFVIGRAEGDLRFPLDGRMSGRHVEITHQYVGGVHRWVVTDLQSTHGMFVRVSKTVLADKAEILVGNGRYRFGGIKGARSRSQARPISVPGLR
jgi:hypothetical protein